MSKGNAFSTPNGDNVPVLSDIVAFLLRLCDVVLSLFFIALSAPLMVVAVCVIKKNSPGPVLFKQKRVGQGGELFTILKFRTMHLNFEVRDRPEVVLKGDSRIFRGGALLRKFRIDELPQFFLVLIGKMSLVGYRPRPLEEDKEWIQINPSYIERYQRKPGITGPQQVWVGRADDPESRARAISYELSFVNQKGLRLLLQYFALTAMTVVVIARAKGV